MANPLIAARDYIRHSIAELQKVTWPSRDTTLRFSVLVIVVSLVFAAFFAALDYGLKEAVTSAFVRTPAAMPQAQPAPVVPDLEPSVELTDDQGNPVDAAIMPTDGETPSAEAGANGEITLPPLQ